MHGHVITLLPPSLIHDVVYFGSSSRSSRPCDVDFTSAIFLLKMYQTVDLIFGPTQGFSYISFRFMFLIYLLFILDK